jgi:putative tryptophan/tyrosine transport system permease protein
VDILLPILEQGLVWSLVGIGVYLTLRVINVPDLTVDGTLTMGAAVAARLLTGGTDPLLATVAGALAGAVGGLMTGVLHTRGKVQPLLAGILSMTALYSVNLRIMGRANIALLRVETLVPTGPYGKVLLFAAVALAVKLLLDLFLKTDLGLALRATGDNDQMVRTLSVSSDNMKVLGLVVSNAIIGLGGALVAQYGGFADAQMGIGSLVVGLAAVIIGEGLFGARTVARATAAVILGSVLYRGLVAMALRAGFAASDLKLVTAVLVVLALTTPRLKRLVKGVA